MIPVQKIEVWQGGSLLHTITDALSIRVREVLTDAVGTFEFAVATKNNGDYVYNDVNVYDTVKIWIDYDSVGATPLTVGKIYRISAPLKTEQGFLRLFYGKNQGEVLERRVKGRKAWSSTAASTIVTEIANDLGLGTSEIESDTTSVTLTTDVDTYFDLLKKLSDYWYDAGNQIKKDFYVDVNNNLVWKSRPLRTTGVETLSVGEEILSYVLTHDATQLKNNITVYGKREVYNPSKYGQTAKVQNPTVHGYTHPSDGDSWTWSSGWTATVGSVAQGTTNPKVGSDYVEATSDSNGDWQFSRTFSPTIHVEGNAGFPMLEFWCRRNVLLEGAPHQVRIFAPDSSNYFYTTFEDPGTNGVWGFNIFSLGDNNVYDADQNPDGQWRTVGSPSWETLGGIEFYIDVGEGTYVFDVDGLCFSFGRYRYTVSNSASQTNYGRRDLVVVDDDLNSTAECQRRAESLLYQKKDPVRRLDIVTNGNTNLLLGDQLKITLPAENISSENFYVMTVEHLFTAGQGWTTAVGLIDTLNTRIPPPITMEEIVRQEFVKRRFYEGPAWRRGG